MEEFLQKIPDLIQVVSVCLFAVMILATIIVRLTPSKADDEYASKAGAFIMKVLGWLPSDSVDVVYALILIAVLIYILAATSGCVSLSEPGDEPIWKPHIYLYSPEQDGRCKFVDKMKHVIDCDEPLMHDFYLAPLEDLVLLKSKLNQCNTWR